jgi:hypothetical protein
MHRAILYGGSSEKENLYNPIIRLTWRNYMIYSKNYLDCQAISLRVFMAAVVPSVNADKCKGYSSSEDGSQTATGFLLGESKVAGTFSPSSSNGGKSWAYGNQNKLGLH